MAESFTICAIKRFLSLKGKENKNSVLSEGSQGLWTRRRPVKSEKFLI